MKFNKSLKKDTYKFVKPGTVFDHTKEVMKAMAEQPHDYLDMFAAMLHDCGKPVSADKNGIREGRTYPDVHDHDVTGKERAIKIAKEMKLSKDEIDTLAYLVGSHMKAHKLSQTKHKSSIYPVVKHPDFDRLIKLAKADTDGSFNTSDTSWVDIYDILKLPLVKEVIEMEEVEPVLTGQDLIDAGYTPGPLFKKALHSAFKIQIDSGETRKQSLLANVKSVFRSQE